MKSEIFEPGEWYSLTALEEMTFLKMLPLLDTDRIDLRKYRDKRGRTFVFEEDYRVKGDDILIKYLGRDDE